MNAEHTPDQRAMLVTSDTSASFEAWRSAVIHRDGTARAIARLAVIGILPSPWLAQRYVEAGADVDSKWTAYMADVVKAVE